MNRVRSSRCVSARPGATLIVGSPTTLFDTKYVESNPARHYDVSPDGQRFVMLKDRAADPSATPASMVVVQHWLEQLEQRMGAGRR